MKMVPMSLRQIDQFMPFRIHAAGGNFMQQGLPNMGFRLVNQGDDGLAFAT